MTRLRLPLIVLILTGALGGCGSSDVSDRAPDFNLSAGDGKSYSLSAQKGRVVLLNFWATWCDSCLEELPLLNKLQADRVDSSFMLLTAAVDDDPVKAVPPFSAAHKLTFPILYCDRKTMDAYGVHLLPTSLLIAPDGSIARRYVGPLDAKTIENDILSLLNRRPS
jgi:thiol-disulfide isomerase/thioredoxin